MTEEFRPYSDHTKPGRLDVEGVEWYACDPYPCWYRWADGKLYRKPRHTAWADGIPDYKRLPCPECGAEIIPQWSGIKCSACPYWYCA